jgi:mercuric ion transport protein
LLLLGIGGSWISSLTQLEPYRPFFILIVITLFSVTGYKLYFSRKDCEPGAACAVVQVQQRRKIIYWIALAFALILVTSNYWVLWFL